jgi:hypothetical protein
MTASPKTYVPLVTSAVLQLAKYGSTDVCYADNAPFLYSVVFSPDYRTYQVLNNVRDVVVAETSLR